jgi:GT2 family glycosyltransferase
MPSVFIVILNYNGNDYLNQCLNSVFRSDYTNLSVIVVDNDSRDGSLENARTNFPKVHFIRNSSNIGFARGNNIGIRFALEKFADYVFLLNNDATILPNTISSLVNLAEKNNSIGIVSPLIKKPQQKEIWFCGGKINWTRMRTEHFFPNKSLQPYLIEYASGCAMLIRKNVFKKIGLLDERYFLYYEDADFCLRANKGGFDIFLLPTAFAIHQESSNTKNPQKIYWLVLSGLIFFKTHASFLIKMWYLLFIPIRRLKAYFSKNKNSPQIKKAFADYGQAIK